MYIICTYFVYNTKKYNVLYVFCIQNMYEICTLLYKISTKYVHCNTKYVQRDLCCIYNGFIYTVIMYTILIQDNSKLCQISSDKPVLLDLPQASDASASVDLIPSNVNDDEGSSPEEEQHSLISSWRLLFSSTFPLFTCSNSCNSSSDRLSL